MQGTSKTTFGIGILLALCGACLVPPATAADTASATLSVTATVREHLRLRMLSQPTLIVITEADIARGYVDMPAAARLEVRSNTRNGYTLVFDSSADFIRATQVRSVHAAPAVAGGSHLSVAGGSGMTTRTHDLSFRFALSDSARQGSYAFPLSVGITPI